MADGSHSVTTAGETAWKRLFGSDSLEDKAKLMDLFELYLGTMNSKTLDEKNKRRPASIRQRLKLMGVFLKSKTAATCFPQNVQVVFETLFGASPSVPAKLRILTVQFVSCVTAACPDSAVRTFCPILYSGVKKLIDQTETLDSQSGAGGDVHLVASAYNCLGKIGGRCPTLVTNDMVLVQRLFERVSLETEEISCAMFECLLLWLPVFRYAKGPCKTVLETLVTSYVSNANSKSRLVALKYLEYVFDSKHVPSRWSLLVACGDSKEEIKREAVRILHNCFTASELPDFCDLVVFIKQKFVECNEEVMNAESGSLRQAVMLSYYCLLNMVGCDLSSADFSRVVDYERHCPKIVKFSNSLLVSASSSVSNSEKWAVSLQSYGYLVWKLCQKQPEIDYLILLSQLWHISSASMEAFETKDWLKNLLVSSSNFNMCAIASELFSHMVSGAGDIDSVLSDLLTTSKPTLISEAACLGLVEIFRCQQEQIEADSMDMQPLIEKLTSLITSRKDGIKPRLREFAANALGFLDSGGKLWPEIFAALSAAGEKRIDQLRTSMEGDNLKGLLEKVLTDKLVSQNRHLRQAAIIWLFVLTENCSWWHPAVIEQLDRIQMAFIDGLAEPNEFAQDVASKGLGVVYDNGNPVQKQQMVSLLVSSLTSGRKESLTTYKELCSLAVDLNQPDLVYKFMRLANHNAIWNSKKGAAFGFSTVLKDAEQQLEPYLSQLIPKLYRYQYDPQSKVQAAMRSVWQMLTTSKKGVIDDFCEEILSELMKSLIHSEWRVRESSCLALGDLLSGHCNDVMTEKFHELWEILFRVRDDIKESVRLASHRALIVLQKVTVKFCGRDRGEKASALIGQILPVLLNQGIGSRVTEVKTVSLQTLISFTKESGQALQKHLSVLGIIR